MRELLREGLAPGGGAYGINGYATWNHGRGGYPPIGGSTGARKEGRCYWRLKSMTFQSQVPLLLLVYPRRLLLTLCTCNLHQSIVYDRIILRCVNSLDDTMRSGTEGSR